MSEGTALDWGGGVPADQLAHPDDEMACYSCHTSWTTSCGGCHLPIEANWLTARHHYEGGISRNWASYNPQVARDEMFQLGPHDSTKGSIIAPVRSSSALVLSSTNAQPRAHLHPAAADLGARAIRSQAFAPHYSAHRAQDRDARPAPTATCRQTNDNNA